MSVPPVVSTCCVFPEPVVIESPDGDYSADRALAVNPDTEHGTLTMSDNELKAERKEIWKLVGKFTEAALTGDLTKVSFPIFFSEERTFLEKIADFYSFIPKFISLSLNERDQVRKFAYIAAGMLATSFTCLKKKKPFNPILGETYATRWENGTEFFSEQISHHPPISAFQVFGPNHTFHLHGTFDAVVNRNMNKLLIKQPGLVTLELSTGEIYTWEMPSVRVKGIFKGRRIQYLKGPFCMNCVTSNLSLKLEFNPKKSHERGITEHRKTVLYGEIVANGGKEPLGRITGDYAREIKFNGDTIWRIEEDNGRRPLNMVEPQMMLKSDSRYRIDRCLYVKKLVPKAAVAKKQLEDCQRREEKLRIKI